MRYSDEELRDAIVAAIVEGGYRNAGAWNKARRAEGQGSNDQLVRKAWQAALRSNAKARRLVEEHDAERAEAFAKARAAKATKAAAATKATKATGTRKASALALHTAAREGRSATTAEVAAKFNVGERLRARRARKAA